MGRRIHQGELHGYRSRQFDHAFDYRTLDFDGPGADSYSTFGRSFDLFGDGSVRLVFTPGHTLGHLSVVLRLKEGEALVAGDAIYLERNLREGRAALQDGGRAPVQALAARDRALPREAPGRPIIPGHDMEAWRKLPRCSSRPASRSAAPTRQRVPRRGHGHLARSGAPRPARS